MKQLIETTTKVRAFQDWSSVYEDVSEQEKVVALGEDVLKDREAIKSSYLDAKRIVDAYPESVGARCLSELLEVGVQEQVLSQGYFQSLEDSLEKTLPMVRGADYLEPFSTSTDDIVIRITYFPTAITSWYDRRLLTQCNAKVAKGLTPLTCQIEKLPGR